MKLSRYATAALVWLAAVGAPALAERACTPEAEHCVAVGTWEFQVALGLGVRTNPLENSSDIPLIVIPQVSYYGERIFLDNLELGYTLAERPGFMLNALITPNGDGLFFFRENLGRFVLDGGINGPPTLSNPPPLAVDNGDPDFSDLPDPEGSGDNGEEPPPPNFSLGFPELRPGFEDTAIRTLDPAPPPPAPAPTTHADGDGNRQSDPQPKLDSRRIAGLAGLETTGVLGPVEWQGKLLHDVTGVHNGWTARFALGTGTHLGDHRLGATLGLDWKSDKLLNYYYGVAPHEAGSRYPEYRASGGVTPFVRLHWRKNITDNWYWLSSVQYEHLSREISRSPLIEDRGVTQVFAGVVYRF